MSATHAFRAGSLDRDTHRPSSEVPGVRDLSSWPAVTAELHGASSRCVKAVLLSPSAAALDEYDQHNHEQRGRNNPDYRGTVHVEFPLIDPNHLKCHERWIDSGTPDAEAAGFPSVTLAAASGAR